LHNPVHSRSVCYVHMARFFQIKQHGYFFVYKKLTDIHEIKERMKTKMKLLVLAYLTLAFISYSCEGEDSPIEPTPTTTPKPADKVETFTFSSNGSSIRGKISIPNGYEQNDDLPAIYLIDFTEQHYQVALDEFDRVIQGVNQVEGLNALVITLAEHLDVNLAIPRDFQEYYDVYKNMAAYVDDHYTSNTSRTFIGRGSEAGQVLLTLFLEEKETSVFQNFIATDTPSMGYVIEIIKDEAFPQEKENKKLHYSFSSNGIRDANIRLINTINEQSYPWLEFKSLEYPDLNYENAYPRAFANGIKFIFED